MAHNGHEKPGAHRSDVLPSKNDFPESKRGESFEEAANPPNNPKKDKQPDSWNVNNDYPHYDNPWGN